MAKHGGKRKHPVRVSAPAGPVTVTRVREAVTRCRACREPVRYAPVPGAAGAALSDHWAEAGHTLP